MNSSPGNCKCGETQYVKNSNPVTCSNCHASCHSCAWKGPSQCITCSDSSLIIASPPGSCTCSTSQYIMYKNPFTCGTCDSSCSTCSGPTANDCLSCTDSAVTLSSTPSSCSCKTSQYTISQSPLTCGNCDSSCATCSGSGSNQCLTCVDSLITVSSSPGSCTCSASEYIINKSPLTCASCHSSCASCSGPLNTDCYTCIDQAVSISNPPDSCSCLSNQYIITNHPLTCGNCYWLCATCLGKARNQCLTCSSSELMLSNLSGACECLPGKYMLHESPIDCGGTCDSSCSTCIGPNEDQCLTCKNSSITLNNIPGKCFCNSSQYVISYSPLICENCNSACLECSGSGAGDCISCKNSSITPSANPGYCSCLTYEYILSASPLHCDLCHNSCESCSGPYYNDCLTCKNLTISPSPDGHCGCKENEYIISVSPLLCGSCDLSCKTCVGPKANQCLSCSEIILDQPSSCRSSNNSSGLSTFSMTIKNSGIAASAGLIIAGFFESIITGKSGSLWTYVNIVQVLAFIPLQNIAIPDNLFQFWKAFLSYTYLHNTGKYIFGENKMKELEPIENFYKYGYESSSFLVNSAGMLLISIVVIASWTLIYCLSFIPNSAIHSQIKKLLEKFKYNILLRLWIEIYILLMAAAVIGINHFSSKTSRTISDTIFAYITFISGWIITFILIFLLYIIQLKIFNKSKKMKRKYGCLFKEFKFSNNYIELLYYPIFLIRRLIFVINLYDLAWIPVVQWVVNVLHSFCIVFLLLRHCHFKNKETHFLNVSGEALVTFSFLLTGPYLLDLPYIIDNAIQCAVLCATYLYLIASYYFLVIKTYNLIKAWRSRDKIYPELAMNAAVSVDNDIITSGRLKEACTVPHNSLESDLYPLDSDNHSPQ
ncbi:unnamed protein product [Blepharisma stoltei]|uniref:TNFR-Cys domain-containing protein n=1 Tax=Blepharisma stoltei TaxID=1481888 RepID=A0AAU9JF06_9CILI|nr:unnamed protein product [Blepharisma stoltei]